MITTSKNSLANVTKRINLLCQELQVEKPNFIFKLTDNVTADFEIKKEVNGIYIKAQEEKQLFYGATKVMQSLLVKRNYNSSYKGAIAERCVMIDMGRKFFSLAHLKQLIRSLALFQFTHLQLHFSENEGFRIESELHPEVVSKAHLKKSEVKEIIAYANYFFIQVIPDFDTPGHLQKILAHYPQYQLTCFDEAGNLTKDKKALNILDPAAIKLIQDFYREYGELFAESCYFHIGADEFVDFDQIERYPTLSAYAKEKYGADASGIEVFIEYVNQTIDFVRQLGFIPRVWNDGFFRLNRSEKLSLSPDCEISYWTRWNQNMAPVETFFEKGYEVINHNDNFFYYVLGEAASYTYPTYEKISQDFTLTTYAGNQVVAEQYLLQTPQIALAIWSDIPQAKTQAEVIADVFYLQAALSQKVFAEEPLKKTDFEPLFDIWQQSLKVE